MISESYQLVRSKLTGIVDDGDQKCKAICPCHDDHNPSLAVSVGENGKVLIKCWGCNASVANIVHALGLTMSQLFPKSDPPEKQQEPFKKGRFGLHTKAIEFYEKKLGPCTAKWAYDVNGNTVGYVARFDPPGQPKEFRPIWRDGNGFVVSAPKENRPLYCVDGITDAVGDGDESTTIYVTEGEKACQAAWSIGLIAVSPMNGAKSPHKTDWSPVKDHDVVILRDNDEAGLEFANTVAELCLAAGAKSARILLLPVPNEKDDIVEWIENHGDAAEPDAMKAEVEAMVVALQPVENKTKKLSKLRFRTAGELVKEYPTLRPSVIHGLLRRGETANIIAASKTGKSWLSLVIALSVVAGLKLFDRFWTKQGKVYLLDNELHEETSIDRVKMVADAMQIPEAVWKDNLTIDYLRGGLVDLNEISLELMGIERDRFDLILLDAWYRFQPKGSDENSNADVTQLYNKLDAVAGAIGASFIAIHHTSKGNQADKAVTDLGSGAGAQARAADTHLTLREHEQPNVVAVHAVTRSFAPMEPFCLRWQFPTWVAAPDCDPAALKQPRARKPNQETSADRKAEQQARRELDAKLKVLEALEAKPDGDTESRLSAAAGMSSRVFSPIIVALRKDGFIVDGKVKKGHANYDSLKLNEAGLGELRQLRQLRQTEDLSDVSDMTPTSALSLESTVCRTSDQTREVSLWKGI